MTNAAWAAPFKVASASLFSPGFNLAVAHCLYLDLGLRHLFLWNHALASLENLTEERG